MLRPFWKTSNALVSLFLWPTNLDKSSAGPPDTDHSSWLQEHLTLLELAKIVAKDYVLDSLFREERRAVGMWQFTSMHDMVCTLQCGLSMLSLSPEIRHMAKKKLVELHSPASQRTSPHPSWSELPYDEPTLTELEIKWAVTRGFWTGHQYLCPRTAWYRKFHHPSLSHVGSIQCTNVPGAHTMVEDHRAKYNLTAIIIPDLNEEG